MAIPIENSRRGHDSGPEILAKTRLSISQLVLFGFYLIRPLCLFTGIVFLCFIALRLES